MDEPQFDLAEARKMREAGATFREIAEHFGGIPLSTVMTRLAKKKPYIPSVPKERVTMAAERHEIAARLAEIPADTRSLTARLLGDPLPGRSALDQARAH